MKYEMKMLKVGKKKKPTKKEIEDLKKAFEDIQNYPVTMRQIRRFITQTA